MKQKKSVAISFLTLSALGCLICYQQSFAQFAKPDFKQSLPNMSLSLEKDLDNILFETSEVVYDNNTGLATTIGGVRAVSPDGKSYFQSNNMVYNIPESLIMISGDVVLKKDDNILTTKDIVMTADFKQIQAGETEIKLADNSVMKAGSMVREEDNVHTLKNTTYTACPIRLKVNNMPDKCETESDFTKVALALNTNMESAKVNLNGKVQDLQETPTWEVYAYKINQNLESKTLSYQHAVVYMWGVPVFYIPYLIHPDPTIENRSGFLFPKIGTSTVTGFSTTIPFYVYMNQYSSLTISPMINSQNGNLLLMDFSRNFENMSIKFDGSTNLIDGFSDNKLWYVNYKSNFVLSEIFRGSLNIRRVSDDTYLRKYNFSTDAWLTSNLSLEGFWERSRLDLSAIIYQDLRTPDSNISLGVANTHIADVYPVLNYYGRTEGDSWGGFWAMNLNTVTMHKQNVDGDMNYRSTRLTGSVLRQNNNILSNGVLLETALFARQDYYNVENSLVTDPNGSNIYLTDSAINRSYIEASAMLSYPMYRNGLLGVEVLEPVVQFVASPNVKRNWKISNMDSLDVELDDKNLFSMNRNPGYDLIETGTRVNYALKWATNYKENNMSFMIGQSYNISNEIDYPEHSGLSSESGFSNLVGRIAYSHRLFNLYYRVRLNNENFQFTKNELALSTNIYKVNLYVDYLFLKNVDDGNGLPINRQEIYYKLSTKFTDYWSAYFNNRYNIEDDNAVSYAMGAQYQNDCFAFSVEMEKKYSYDRDYKGDTSIFFTFAFKNIGTFKTKSSFDTNTNRTSGQ